MGEIQLHCGWAVSFNVQIKKAMGNLILLYKVVIEEEGEQGSAFPAKQHNNAMIFCHSIYSVSLN